jgi:hypothetical protein
MSTTITKVSSYRTWQNDGTSMIKSMGGNTTYDFTSLLANYYTKTELQTNGLSSVNFGNITNAYHNFLLGLQGGLIVGDSDNPDSSGSMDDEMFHLDESTYLDVTGISFTMSIEKDSLNIVTLVGDEANPGLNKYYGTNAIGTKGWYDSPEAYAFDSSGNVYFNFSGSLVEDSLGIVTLFNDEDDPGNNKYYGTNLTGIKGWYDQPTGTIDSGDLLSYVFLHSLSEDSAGYVNLVNDLESPGSLMYYGTDINSVKGWHELSITEFGSSGDWGIYTFSQSLVDDGTGLVTLVNDASSPGNSKLYGTNASGVRGWYDIPSVTGFVDVSGTPSDNQIAIFTDANTIEGNANFTFNGTTFYMIGNIQTHTTNTNTVLGLDAYQSDTSGEYNSAIGTYALYSNTEGDCNSAIGTYALYSNTEGYWNAAVGESALYSNTTGYFNLAIGPLALYLNTTGFNNIAIGIQAGSYAYEAVDNQESNCSTYLGCYTHPLDNGDTNEIVIGYDAIGQGSNTTVIGNYDTIATYLAGNIYFVLFGESGEESGSLPLADSSITQIVMYDPVTGKLYYGAGTGGDITYTFGMSLNESAGTVTLDNDSASPGNSKYYGTNGSGTKGWFDLPAGGGIDGSGANTRIAYWTDADTLSSDADFVWDGANLVIKIGGANPTTITSFAFTMADSSYTYVGLFPDRGSGPGVDHAFLFNTTSDIGYNKLFLIQEANAETFFVDSLAMHHHNDCNANFFVQKYTLGATPIISHDDETSTANTAYTKLKTITLGAHVLSGRQLKIQFDLKMNTDGNPPYAYGQIRRNGDVIGTEQTNGTDAYETFSEDITGWYAGDTIELWAKAISTYTAYVRNFRVCGGHESGIVNEVTGSIS